MIRSLATIQIHDTMTSASRYLSLLLPALFVAACSSGSGPSDQIVPEGIFHRVDVISGGELHRGLRLEADSAFLFDTVFSNVGGTLTVDSIRILELELNPSADGYFRAVEEEHTDGSAITDRSLRYWYFYQRGDTLRYYRGMRFRGEHVSIVGDWSTSAADSAYLDRSYHYTFTDDSVTVRTEPEGSVVTTSYTIHDDGVRRLEFGPGELPPFGPRFEVVPALALYLTSEASPGYRKVATLTE